MFRIKICGITNFKDARAAADAGADALGFNFYRHSKRYIDREEAWQIVFLVPDGFTNVGVFVNHSVDEIAETSEHLCLSFVQLHGGEPPILLAELPANIRIVRAFSVGQEGLAPLADYLADCSSLGRMPDAVLLDSDAGTEYGGTGRIANWERIAKDRHLIGNMPLILAGGLTPDNIAEAIDAVRPSGVDVASGVESQPGQKDPTLIERFVAAARAAFVRYD